MYISILSAVGAILLIIFYFKYLQKESERVSEGREEHYKQEISRLQKRIQYMQENKDPIAKQMSIEDFNKTVEFFNQNFSLDAKTENMAAEHRIQKLNYEPASYEYIFALALSYSSFFIEFLAKMEAENEGNQKHYFIRDIFDIDNPEDILRYLFCDYVHVMFFSNTRHKISNHKKVLLDNVSDFIDYVIEDHSAKLAKESIFCDED